VEHWALVYHWAEVALGVAVMVVAIPRIRALVYQAPIESKPFFAELEKLLASDRERAKRLARAAEPAWAGRAALLGMTESSSREMQAFLDDLAFEAQRSLTALRALGRLASAAGLLGAVFSILWMLEGDHGILRLAAGRVEAIALEDAIISVALGMSISMFAISVRRMLVRQGTRLLRDSERAIEIVLAARERELDAPPVV
jgi:biopolymer transport protein ExbB/TolQ